MCRHYSCIVVRTGKVYGQTDDPSHTEIARRHKLPEDGKSELFRAKVEVVPRDGYTYGDAPTPETWEVIVDEPTRPDWYGDRHDRAAMASAQNWWRSRVIAPDAVVTVTDGLWFVLEGSPQITQSGGVVWNFDRSAATITQSGGVVRNFDQSAVTTGRLPRIGAFVPLVYFASSLTQSGRGIGVFTLAVLATASATEAIGPCTGVPPSSKRSTGGVLPTAASSNGLTL